LFCWLVCWDESTGRNAECQAPFFPILAMKVIAAIFLVCAKEFCSFGYVKSVCKFMQENFGKQMETLQDLI
jgi:hypothetical protein